MMSLVGATIRLVESKVTDVFNRQLVVSKVLLVVDRWRMLHNLDKSHLGHQD